MKKDITGNQDLSIFPFSFFYHCVVIFAHWFQSAFIAFGIAGNANISAVQYQPVVEFMNQFFGNVSNELHFCLQRIFGVYS